MGGAQRRNEPYRSRRRRAKPRRPVSPSVYSPSHGIPSPSARWPWFKFNLLLTFALVAISSFEGAIYDFDPEFPDRNGSVALGIEGLPSVPVTLGVAPLLPIPRRQTGWAKSTTPQI